MNTRILLLILGVFGCLVRGADDDRPILKEPTSRLVSIMESTGWANFHAACLNVTRDAKEKRLRIYAVTPTAKTGATNIADLSVEVIYNGEVVNEDATAAGSYHQHHNALVLRFAAAEFASGNKELGLRLVQMLANAAPEMWWSSPTHQPLTIKKILEGLRKDDESVRHFLKEESEDWKYRVKNYGPTTKAYSQ
jgi:hypothetical protein